MKKYFIPLFVIGISLFYSCSKEDITTDNDSSSDAGKVKMEFKAGIDPVSRTVLVAGNKVNWEENDAISLFDQNSNNKFTIRIHIMLCIHMMLMLQFQEMELQLHYRQNKPLVQVVLQIT